MSKINAHESEDTELDGGAALGFLVVAFFTVSVWVLIFFADNGEGRTVFAEMLFGTAWLPGIWEFICDLYQLAHAIWNYPHAEIPTFNRDFFVAVGGVVVNSLGVGAMVLMSYPALRVVIRQAVEAFNVLRHGE